MTRGTAIAMVAARFVARADDAYTVNYLRREPLVRKDGVRWSNIDWPNGWCSWMA